MPVSPPSNSKPRSSGKADLLNSRALDHVVVLGANGTMGYGSGALFTTAVPRVTFLARTKDKADKGLAAAIRSVRSHTVGERVTTGSYDDMAAALADADLVFEAVAEDFAVKDELYSKVDAHRRPDSIVASVTSGLSISALAKKRSESFARNFLGLHFFNPPNVIVGTEIIAGEKTDPSIVDFLDAYCTKRLGRIMVRTSDTPGFAGNRVGFKVLNEVAQLAQEHGPVLMDKLVGPYTGRAMSPLATIDLVGWDVHRAIVDNIYEKAPDEARETLRMPDYMRKLMEKGVLGNKSGSGFFKRGEEKLALDIDTGEYVPAKQAKLPDLSFIRKIANLHRVGEYRRAMEEFVRAEGPHAALARKVIAGYIAYAFHRVGEVTETITGIDLIMGAGFNWAPPGVLVDLIGLRGAVEMIEKSGLAAPAILAQELSRGRKERFFKDPRFNTGKFFVAA
jgi:3-hydroxyacyl-CoA dehydrogenase